MPNMQETTEVVNSRMCRECDEYFPVEVMRTNISDARRGWQYCEPCFEDVHEYCEDCGEDGEDSYIYGSGRCESCEEERENRGSNEDGEDDVMRPYATTKLPEFMSSDTGDFITSPRIFSAEIECYYPDTDALKQAARELPRGFGISGDGSLNYRGIEFQTPMLQGLKGEAAIYFACKTLNRLDFTTDRSCGLHVHLDAKDLLPATRTKSVPNSLKKLWLMYMAYEEVLISFLPPSRRGNRFCKTFRNDYHRQEVMNVENLEQLEKLWYRASKRIEVARKKENKYESSRYFGLNLHSLLRDGHVEIRFHSGTLNSTKILEWVVLHQAMLDACLGSRFLAVPNEFLELSEKTEHLFDTLQLPEHTREYLRMRQATFSSRAQDNDESVCAE